MIYSRLRIAKSFLKSDGVIFISIDDNEQHNLRKVCDEIFGVNSFVGVFPWRSRTAKTDVPFAVSKDVEWVIAYANPNFYAGREGIRKYYQTDDYSERWRLQDLTKNMTKDERVNSFFTMINPKTGEKYPANESRVWSVTTETFDDYYKKGKIVFPGDYDFLKLSKPAFRVFESEDKRKALQKYGTEDIRMPISTYLPENKVKRTEDGTKEIQTIFGKKVFSYPKPTSLIQFFVESVCDKNALIMDFFAGSGTTAQAIFQQNAKDGGNRTYILIQLPETLNENFSSQRTAANYCRENGLDLNIAALTRERIRRVGTSILQGECHKGWNRDIGFRALRVDSSNMADVYYVPDDTKQTELPMSVDNIKQDREPEDLLFQILLNLGLDLTLPIRKETIQMKTVFFAGDGELVSCLDTGIDESLITELIQFKPMCLVFRDDGFLTDAAKINVEQICKQISSNTEVISI